jgi:hypothetical protein
MSEGALALKQHYSVLYCLYRSALSALNQPLFCTVRILSYRRQAAVPQAVRGWSDLMVVSGWAVQDGS